MSRVTSFVADEDVGNILAEVPWGKRSAVINDCIRLGIEAAVKKWATTKELPAIPLNNSSKKSGGSQASQTPSLKREKPSSETDHGANRQNTSSAENTRYMKKLLKILSKEEG